MDKKMITLLDQTELYIKEASNDDLKLSLSMIIQELDMRGESIELHIKKKLIKKELYWDKEETTLKARWTEDENINCHGLYEYWYRNGQLKIKSNWKNGKHHGLYEEWNSSGEPMEKKYYKNGVEIEKLKYIYKK